MRHTLLIFLTVLIGACATVTSKHQNNTALKETSAKDIQGLLYFLPKRQVTLTATQKPVTAKTVSEAQQKLTKEIAAVTEAKAAAQKARTDFANAHSTFPNGDGSPEEQFANLMATLQLNLKIKESILSKAESNRDQAAADLVEAKAAHAAGIPIYKIKLELSASEPDAKYAFRADYKHNWLRDDEFSLSINNRGLLSSSNITATDQSSQILAELAGASAAIGAKLPELTMTAQSQSFMALQTTDDKQNPVVEHFKTPTCEFPIDLPHQYQMSFDPTDSAQLTEINKELAKCFPYFLQIDPPGGIGPEHDDNTLSTNLKGVEGLVYRPALPYVLTVKQCTSDFTVLGPNNRKAFISCEGSDQGEGSEQDEGSDRGEGNDQGDESKQIVQRAHIASSFQATLSAKLANITEQAEKKNLCKKAGDDQSICQWIAHTEELNDALKFWVDSVNVNPQDLDDSDFPLISPTLRKIMLADLPDEKSAKKAAQDILTIAKELRNTLRSEDAPSRGLDPVQSTIVMLPNNAPLSIIPMKSSAFVSSVHDVTFENGMVTQWDRNAPSEVLEIVRLPVKILSSIIEVPARIFQLRVNLSDDQSALIDAQRSQIESQLALQVLQDCIEKAQLGKIEMTECLPPAQ